MNVKRTVKAGRMLLKAFVLAKSGRTKQAGILFNELAEDVSIDPVMDGIAKSITEIESTEDEDTSMDDTSMDDEDIEDDEDTEDEEDIEVDSAEDAESIEEDDEEIDTEDDSEDSGDEGSEIEIPASVAKVLNLRY